MLNPTRREVLGAMATLPIVAAGCSPASAPERGAGANATPPSGRSLADAPLRDLGRTGARVPAFSLGGEGVLRTRGRALEAVPVILEALRLGVCYCDTAPAYAESQDYYGAAFREAGKAARDGVFLATKTRAIATVHCDCSTTV